MRAIVKAVVNKLNALVLIGGLTLAMIATASLENEAAKAFRKIGVGPEQTLRYADLYEKFLKRRNSNVRRTIYKYYGEELPIQARKAARRAARKSVKDMAEVLTPLQLEYYETYLELANKMFLRDAGLR